MMNIMIQRLVILGFLFWHSVAAADSVVGTTPIPPENVLSGFGSSEVYRAQVFYNPSDDPQNVKTITVYVGPTSDLNAKFRVLLTQVTFGGQGDVNPTKVIFESGPLELKPSADREPSRFEVEPSDIVTLEPGYIRAYALIFDYFSDASPTDVVSMGTGLGTYALGKGYSFQNGPVFPTGTREQHFESSEWRELPDTDFAFQVELNDVSVFLPVAVLIAIAALMIALWRSGWPKPVPRP